jgi:hypothetical protein
VEPSGVQLRARHSSNALEEDRRCPLHLYRREGEFAQGDRIKWEFLDKDQAFAVRSAAKRLARC